jgi:addiction module HigA family antidote
VSERLRVTWFTYKAKRYKLRVPATRIGEIGHGRRATTTETSFRLARYFGTSPGFWLNLGQGFDLTKARTEHEEKIAREVQAYAG